MVASSWNQNCGERAIAASFYQAGSSVQDFQLSGMINSNGDFTVPDVDTGTCDVLIKVQGLPIKRVKDFVVSIRRDE